MIKKLFLFLAIAAAVAACSSKFDALLMSNDVDAKYDAAFNYFNSGKYRKAASLFESLSVMTTGTERDDTVQFYWGLSNYKNKDYYTAEANFSKFVNNFPRSPFSSEARFMRIDCLYRSTLRYELDQIPTYTAINAIDEYLRDYPNEGRASECIAMSKTLNDRLDKKAFENAKLYYKMEDFKASRVAFKNIIKNDPDNIYREDILYYIAMSSYKYAKNSIPDKQKERYLDFIDDYLNFIGEIPDSPYRKELNAMYLRAQRAVGKAVGEDATDKMKDKDFERERKAAAKK
ncbi:MAG: outer membrane protein assembly factor BamD [Bacteroidales bacterium]|nr:outer membrane protein assembly factor BamD [Bacteroidales bacterium]MDT3360900.1 outer membrane protein assembly factor BamD [Bacteroidota bacterium]